jgi:4-hydroxyacetophenone monooxygenase
MADANGSLSAADVSAEAAIAVIDPMIALLALVHITGDRTLINKYGARLEGAQTTTREAFTAINPEEERAKADDAAIAEVRALLLKAVKAGRQPILKELDMALFREMSKLALGLELPELSMEPALQHGGFVTDTRVRKAAKTPPADFKVLVVGAGMIGINAAVKLQQAGFDYHVIEGLPDVGGTWYVNTYPGAAVDTPSRVYSYSFEPNAAWTTYYPNGPEFLSYLRRVTEKYGVSDRIEFNTWVSGAEWDEAKQVWKVRATRDGNDLTYTANALIMATGPNNGPKFPDVKNLDAFKGKVTHGAAWDHSIDLKGKKVVMVGSAASGVQIAKTIADQVADLTIVMRQPEYLLPNPQAGVCIDDLEIWSMENVPFVSQWKRLQALSSQLQDMRGMATIDEEHRAKTGGVSPMNDGIRDMCRGYIKSHFPDNPKLVEDVTPDFPVFAKRPILDPGFYDTLKKPNVHLIRGAIEACDSDAVILQDGTRVPADVIIFATGYQMHWGTQFDIKGRSGKTLKDTFDPAPFSYSGMMVPDYPNFFLPAGPYSHLTANHAIVSEQQVHYMIELLQTLVDEDASAFEVTQEACRAFVEDCDKELAKTTWVNSGTAHGYYRHQSGKVIMAIPRHNSQVWHEMRSPVLEDFHLTKRPDAKPAPVREKSPLAV